MEGQKPNFSVEEGKGDEEPKTRRGPLFFTLVGVAICLVLIGAVFLAYYLTSWSGPPGGLAGRVTASPEATSPTSPTFTPAGELPAPPSAIEAVEIAVFDVPLSWQDNSDNEDGFNVYRRRLDILEAPVSVGSTGVDETAFLDQETLCGATYQYIVASFNEAGESPATECWVITLPPCPQPRLMRLALGKEYGRNFLTGALGQQADFYLTVGPTGKFMFAADQEGQQGLIDLGNVGEMPLDQVNLPQEPVWQREEVAAVPGHTYAALARDGESVIVFTLSELGNPSVLEYIVHHKDYTIAQSQCPSMGGREPGGPCISGDGVCDPTCVPDTAQLGSPVPEDFFSQPDDLPGAPTGSPPVLAVTYLQGYVPDEAGKPLPDYPQPTFTEQDLDCSNQPCIDGDGVCNPLCATSPNFTAWVPEDTLNTADLASLYVDSDCGENRCVTGDGVCDPTCIPNPNDPGRQSRDVLCYDRDGDGQMDECVPAQVTGEQPGGEEGTTCQCRGDNLVCGDTTYYQFPACNTNPSCSCDGTTLYCDDGTSYKDFPACVPTLTECACDGTTLRCGNQPPQENHPACTGEGETPGGSSRIDGDCGGRCVRDGICTPNCDPFWDPYDDPTQDDPGNDYFTAAPLSYQPVGAPDNAVDPDCGPPCSVNDNLCTCLPTTAITYGDQRLEACSPQCGCEENDYVCRDAQGEVVLSRPDARQCQQTCLCEGVDYVCRDVNGKEVSRVRNAQGCAPVCACEGLDLVCRDRFTQREVSRSAGDPACAPAYCECQANDYVCFDASGKEIYRSVEDLQRCGCVCRGPDVYCGTRGYIGTFPTECGCSCDGTTLYCPDGTSYENYPTCLPAVTPTPQCRCECGPNGCFDTCTQRPCKP